MIGQTPGKEDFPPLWPPGLHVISFTELLDKCVASFKFSKTRIALFKGFVETVELLLQVGVTGRIWIDGSFVTEKINPRDIDYVLEIDAEVYDHGSSELKRAVDALIDPSESDGWIPHEGCDTNVMFMFSEDQSNSSEVRRYWQERFGFSVNDKTPKGIAVVEIGSRS